MVSSWRAAALANAGPQFRVVPVERALRGFRQGQRPGVGDPTPLTLNPERAVAEVASGFLGAGPVGCAQPQARVHPPVGGHETASPIARPGQELPTVRQRQPGVGPHDDVAHPVEERRDRLSGLASDVRHHDEARERHIGVGGRLQPEGPAIPTTAIQSVVPCDAASSSRSRLEEPGPGLVCRSRP